METIVVKLKGQEYKAKLDFATLGKIQTSLRKHQDIKLGFQEIFSEIQEQNFAVITEVIIQAVLRCHPQIKRELIEEKLTFDELENVFTFLAELIEKSMPVDKEDNKKK